MALELELKAARYTAERARQQYDATDPKNRLVADELERRWNRALEGVAELEARIARERSQHQPPSLPWAPAFVSLAQDINRLWEHPQTDVRLKKRILRTLIEEVLVDVSPEAGEVQLIVHWKGGVHTGLNVARRRRGQNSRHTPAAIVETVEVLRRITSDDNIAGWLNQNGLRTGSGKFWTKEAVASVRNAREIAPHSVERQQAEGWMTLTQAADFTGISTKTLRCAAQGQEIPALHPLPGDHGFFGARIWRVLREDS